VRRAPDLDACQAELGCEGPVARAPQAPDDPQTWTQTGEFSRQIRAFAGFPGFAGRGRRRMGLAFAADWRHINVRDGVRQLKRSC